MGKTTKTGGDAVRAEQSAPGMPQYNQLQEDSTSRSSFRPEPIRVITAVPKAKEMETLALISALLLTVAGSGLFAATALPVCVQKTSQHNPRGPKLRDSTAAGKPLDVPFRCLY